MSNLFEQFTNQYELSKTLRFELRPVGKTEEILKINEVFEKDKTIDDAYKQAKFYFDTLHQTFINESLSSCQIDFSEYEKLFLEFKKIKQQKNDLNKLNGESNEDFKKRKDRLFNDQIKNKYGELRNKMNNLRKQIVQKFNEKGEGWKKQYTEKGLKFGKCALKQKEYNFILSAGVLKILKYEYPQNKEQEFQKLGYPSLFVIENEAPHNIVYIFNKFERVTGYLTKFQKTRKNMYSEKDNGTAIANRIINENLQLFLENKIHFAELKKENIDFTGKIEVDLRAKSLEDIFSLKFYNSCLLQNDIKFYNKVIDGEIKELANGKKQHLKGLNQIINEYKQEHKKDTNFKKTKFTLFKSLDKQILGEEQKEKELIEVNQAGEDNLFDRLQEFIDENEKKVNEADGLFQRLVKDREFDEELNKIYLSSKAINTISRKWFQNSYDFEILLPQKSKKKAEKEIVKLKDFISLVDIKEVLNEEIESTDIYKNDYEKICNGETNFENFLKIWEKEFYSLFEEEKNKKGKITCTGYKTALEKIKTLPQNFDWKKEGNIEIIKNYADASLRIFQMMKYFALEKGKKKNPENLETGDFYVEFSGYYDNYQIIKYYDAFRNFLTKKPYSQNKIKLNFDHSKLLEGFTESKTGNSNNGTQYGAYLFRKMNELGFYDYFLGVSKDAHLISKFDKEDESLHTCYERLNYYQIKMNSIYGTSYKGNFQNDKKNLSEEKIIKKLKKALFGYKDKIKQIQEDIINKKFHLLKDIQNAINEVVKKYGKIFEYKFVTELQFKQARDCKKGFYLFQIYNKDFSKKKGEKSKHKNQNLHTIYFKALMAEDNQKFDLGNGEIFLRKASIDPIVDKNRKTKRTIIRNKRYTEDKIFLHLSTVWNYGKQKIDKKIKKWYLSQFNKETNQKLVKKLESINIIGIDRGEKHLAYYSVVNNNQEIIDQGSFNIIAGHDYHQKLDEKEKKRMESRKSWQSIGNIKDLKQGYISQVVRKIADLIIQHNAIVVFEDLNFGFKRGRQKIEKQVYQKLEKALIEKLNFLVNKGEKDPSKAGHLLNAYQLTAPFTRFKDMRSQNGIIFYIQAGYTSTTDPLTGWRKNIYISNSLPIDKPKKGNGKYIKGEIQNFKNIGWDESKQSYFFEYDQKDFDGTDTSKIWQIYADVKRLRGRKNDLGYWKPEFINPNVLLKGLFEKFGFVLKGDIKKQIEIKEKNGELRENKQFDGEERNFYKSLIYCLNLILQIRNSSSARWIENDKGEIAKAGKEADFIQSPVEPFFATKCQDYEIKENFAGFENKIIGDKRLGEEDRKNQIVRTRIIKEFNGDANGAYNIARKGLIMLKKIKDNPEKPDLFISNRDWDLAAQNWEKFLQKRKAGGVL
ncbi:MAG: type V CRISPR-associated protein Cas12a/Cpf1 [Patescibacteria group bacterium]